MAAATPGGGPTATIRAVFVANRGEIANRISHTCDRLGIRAIVPETEGPEALDLLDAGAVVQAAVAAGADALHPGFGFLAENAEFAEAVTGSRLRWVGPPPAAIRAMGDKAAARRLAVELGVPVLAGYDGGDQSNAALEKAAERIGFPLLVKPAAGGGGKGMRTVRAADALADSIASARREASAAFADDRLILERLVVGARHVEIQVLFDAAGDGVHLGERDCSVQRRHQKVLEETPSPAVDPELRRRLGGMALALGRAVSYVGAGTCEFLLDGRGEPSFLEMNTRLQVEHPVTEEITGVDLVEWQLRVASGEPIPLRQEELSINGHAIEARLYAEDPAKGFLPSIGTLDFFDIGEWHLARIETGVERKGEITPYYDPMIAKIVVHAKTREFAAYKLGNACGNTIVAPVKTNAGFLARALRHPEFRAGGIDTGFIARNESDLVGDAEPPNQVVECAAMAVLHAEMGDADAVQLWRYQSREEPQPYAGSVWRSLAGFRISASPQIRVAVTSEGKDYVLDKVIAKPAKLSTIIDGRRVLVADMGQSWLFTTTRNEGTGHHHAHDGDIVAPMPGKVIAVDVAEGDTVTAGQRLLVLEAMKMEHALTAPFDGIVTELSVSAGSQVQVEAVLAVVEAAASGI